MKLVRIVLDNVNEGRNGAGAQFPEEFDPNEWGTDHLSPDGLLEGYGNHVTEAIDSDGITWSMVVEEMQMMMEAEGVHVHVVSGKSPINPSATFFQRVILSWPELD